MKLSPRQSLVAASFVLSAGVTALWPYLPEDGRVCRPTGDYPNEYEVIGKLNRQRAVFGTMMGQDKGQLHGLGIVFSGASEGQLVTMSVDPRAKTCKVVYPGWSPDYSPVYRLEGPSYWAILRGLKAS